MKTGLYFLAMVYGNGDGSDWSRCPPQWCGVGRRVYDLHNLLNTREHVWRAVKSRRLCRALERRGRRSKTEDVWVGGGNTLSKSCDSKILGNCGSQETIVPPCLVREPKETEEGERAEDGTPSIDLRPVETDPAKRGPGKLRDSGISPMDVGPGEWLDRFNRVLYNSPRGQGNGEDKVSGGHKHKTPVATVGRAGVGGDEILDKLSPVYESAEGKG